MFPKLADSCEGGCSLEASSVFQGDWEGPGRKERSERPPPPAEAITVTAAVSPHLLQVQGKTLWDALDTLLQIHRNIPFPFSLFSSVLPFDEDT